MYYSLCQFITVAYNNQQSVKFLDHPLIVNPVIFSRLTASVRSVWVLRNTDTLTHYWQQYYYDYHSPIHTTVHTDIETVNTYKSRHKRTIQKHTVKNNITNDDNLKESGDTFQTITHRNLQKLQSNIKEKIS